MICPKIFLIIWICAFFISYLFVGFLGSIYKFFGEGGLSIKISEPKLKFFLLMYKPVYFFQKVGGGCLALIIT